MKNEESARIGPNWAPPGQFGPPFPSNPPTRGQIGPSRPVSDPRFPQIRLLGVKSDQFPQIGPVSSNPTPISNRPSSNTNLHFSGPRILETQAPPDSNSALPFVPIDPHRLATSQRRGDWTDWTGFPDLQFRPISPNTYLFAPVSSS